MILAEAMTSTTTISFTLAAMAVVATWHIAVRTGSTNKETARALNEVDKKLVNINTTLKIKGETQDSINFDHREAIGNLFKRTGTTETAVAELKGRLTELTKEE